MKRSSKLFKGGLLLLLAILASGTLRATHNRAGEITYEQIDEVTIRATITTYTRTSSFSADRDSLELDWGDGQIELVYRVNNGGQELENDIKVNIYVAEHTYPSRGTYTMSVVDPNRIAGILNIDFPNSVNIQFYIETTFTLLDPRFQGANNSVILLQPPIDYACPGNPFTYNPSAYDPDGDSIAYELITPFQARGVEVPNYVLPDQISIGPENMVSLDVVTGDFLWDSPKVLGEFNITYRINEFRDGVLINSVVRDMQILVRACPEGNRPPEIEVIDEYCVIAGEAIDIDIFSIDPDTNEVLTITALGGPFSIEDNPALFDIVSTGVPSTAAGRVRWQTTCDHVSEEYYQIVVKSTDIETKPRSSLATLRTIRIKVVAPSPVITEVVKENDLVTIRWDASYICDEGELFQGFSVWRKEGVDNFVIDSCAGGLEGSGYQQVVFLTNDFDNLSYLATDSGLERGKIYCYRVVAEFASLTTSGNLFNRTASLASEPLCLRSSGEEPLITMANVLVTDGQAGAARLEWILPEITLIDTTELIGPYKIDLYQSEGFLGENFGSIPIASTVSVDRISSLVDTSYESNALNTVVGPYSYKVDFVSGDAVFSSSIASTIFLQANGNDRSINLSWEENVPWNNYEYIIHQVVSPSNQLELSSVAEMMYEITDLNNGEEYCYVVESRGSYGLKNVQEPLINFSNIVCEIPRDLLAPCIPNYIITTVCEDPSLRSDMELINEITWSSCLEDDLAGYRVYFKAAGETNFALIEDLGRDELQYAHILEDNIAGCYALTSYDSGGNESEILDEVCVDNCPSFVLPNTFTPNSDQSNDLYVPRVNNFIDRVEFEVYNRWGQKVWETTDPQINWDGTNFDQKELAEGTYYYICRIFEKRVTGIEEGADVLRGNIHLLK